jgi:hypothetical protein
MRVFLSSMLAVVLACAAVAQNGSQDQYATSSPTLTQTQDQSSREPQKPLRPTELYGFRNRDTHTCLFIRSYNFERRGTEAPRLKSVTTCTPAKTDQFRQTERKPQVRLIPAN